MIAKPEHLFLCDYPVSTLKGTGSGLVQHVTCKEFHMERILLCGSETREKRKLFLLLWHKRPLCPGFLFLFLICNHFLTDVHVARFLISSPMLTSVNGQACMRRAWSLVPTPGLTLQIDHAGPGAGLPGQMELFNPVFIRHDYQALGVCPACSTHFLCQIKVQEGYINDNLELCPDTEAAIWVTSSITLSPKARKEKGKLCLSTTSVAQPHPTTPLALFPEPIIVVLINWFRDLRFPDLITGLGKYWFLFIWSYGCDCRLCTCLRSHLSFCIQGLRWLWIFSWRVGMKYLCLCWEQR